MKQRNILRFFVSQTGEISWILCDMDASAHQGEQIGKKTSSGYAPPELAARKFSCTCGGTIDNDNPCTKCALENAEPSFDVWALGVILFELCAGRTLFAQDTNNDELVEFSDKTRLCVWQTISDEELAPVLKEAQCERGIADAAKALIRWCLKGSPSERPTVQEILSHGFLDQAAGAVQEMPMRCAR